MAASDAVEQPPLISYAQNAEDVRLLRVLGPISAGFWVDVGAADPLVGSVTKLFSERGWDGINIEPGPDYAGLVRDRPDEINLELVIGQDDCEVAFHITYPELGLSTVDLEVHRNTPAKIERVETVVRRQRSLQAVLRDHCPHGEIHFLKVDVEGGEEAVLRSNDWTRFRPWVVVVEAVGTWGRDATHSAWEPILTAADYLFAAFDGVNRFYVASEHADLKDGLAYPISPLDRYEAYHHRVALSERAVALEALARARREVEQVRREVEQIRRELSERESELEVVYTSRSWRASVHARHLLSPVVGVARAGRRAYGRAGLRGVVGAAISTSGARRRSAREFTSLTKSLPSTVRVMTSAELSQAVIASEALALVPARQAGVPSDGRARAAAAELGLAASMGLGLNDPWEEPIADPGAVEAQVVVNANCLQIPTLRDRGVGRHALSVLRSLKAAAGDRRLALLLSPDFDDVHDEVSSLADAVVHSASAVRIDGVELFLSLSPLTDHSSPAAPFLRRPGTVTAALIYDFIPAAHPTRYLGDPHELIRYHARLNVLSLYDRGLAISADTASLTTRYLGWSDDRVSITGVVDPLPDESAEGPTSDRPYVLAPTGADERKNLAGAVQAFGRAFGADDVLDLRIVGSLSGDWKSTMHELAAQAGVSIKRLHFHSDISEGELCSLYRNAQVAIVPSRAEGFSLPVLEAIRRGCPVVGSDIPSHREIAGVGWWLCPSDDIEALALALTRAANAREELAGVQRATADAAYAPDLVEARLRSEFETLLASRTAESAPRTAAKPRIAVISPLPPHWSGVADYTAATFRAIGDRAEVTLVPSVADPVDAAGVRTMPFSYRALLPGRFDRVVTVIGNSHFHLLPLGYLEQLGGPAIAHDTRMAEYYAAYRKDEAPGLLGLNPADPEHLASVLDDLEVLPRCGYDDIARLAKPLIVHSRRLARRIEQETGTQATALWLAPYNVPAMQDISSVELEAARHSCGFEVGELHIGLFGELDIRTKAADRVVLALDWLRKWGRDAWLHIVGDAHPHLRRELEQIATDVGLAGRLRFEGRVAGARWSEFMLAMDVAVQLRTSSVLSVSGALVDAIAYGLPTVTTEELKEDHDAPSYVLGIPVGAGPLNVAEAIDALAGTRGATDAIEEARKAYLKRYSANEYATALLKALGLPYE